MTVVDLLAAADGRGLYILLAVVLVVGFAVGYPLARRPDRLRADAADAFQQALDLRTHGAARAGYEPSSTAYAWADVPLPEARKLALIAAGIRPVDALDPGVAALDDDELRILGTLHPRTPSTAAQAR